MTVFEANIITQLSLLKEVTLDPLRMTICFPITGNKIVVQEIKNLGFQIDSSDKLNTEIDLNALPFNIYFDDNDFIKRTNRNSWNKSIFIFSTNLFYSINEEKTYKANVIIKNNFLILNNHYCFKFFDFLKTQEHQENSAFYFVDYLNWDTYHLVLTSLKKDGKIDILLPKSGVTLYDNIKLQNSVMDFIGSFNENNKHYPKFIKTELIANLTRVEKSKRLETLLVNLQDIMYVASQNFEIYLHDLSLENLKKEFIEQKNKYFIQLRDVLSKLTNQVIGLPIAIGVSVFSTYKVVDSTPTLFLVLFVFCLYAFFTIYLLKLQKEDIQDIRLTFHSDFNALKESQYFIKFPIELIEFEKIKFNLDSRINSLIIALNMYFFFASISNIAFTIYVENQFKISFVGLFITASIMAIGFTVIYILTQTLKKN